MNINIQEDASLSELEIQIRCPKVDEQILKILATLHALDKKVTGEKNGQLYLLEAKNILYIDTVDKKTFFYTKNDVYETPLKLYELEEKLAGNDFFRAGKSLIINFNHIKSLKPDFGGRIGVLLSNGEKMYISRQYASVVKEKLGLI